VDIPFAARSRFLDTFEADIRRHRAELDRGGAFHIPVSDGGYDGRVTVTIRPGDHAAFGTDWQRADPTRFPARIKAAATALRNCGRMGRFAISHSEGVLTIRAMYE
jgi:hypothetical protein